MAKKVSNKVAQNRMRKSISELEKLSTIFKNPSDLMLAIAEEGKELVKEQLEVYGISKNGELGSSIEASIVDKNTAQLSADGGHAIFVEYGAGIVGKKHPHELAKKHGVVYNEGSQIQHFKDKNQDFWTYFDEDKGTFFRTHGQQSKPFMLKGVKRLTNKTSSIIKSKIKELSK